jgi:hypothetical protein
LVYVIENHDFRLFFGFWNKRAEAFGFERGPKAFHRGVVVAVAFATH